MMRMASCHPDRKNYARGACRSCYNMAYALTHKEERRRDRASWYRRKGRAYNAAYHLEHAHGITVIERETMLRAQGGICAICGAPENGRPLSVDHDHATGHIRGLLCKKMQCRPRKAGNLRPRLGQGGYRIHHERSCNR